MGMAPRQCRGAGHSPLYPHFPTRFTPGGASSLQFTEIPTWPAEATEFAIPGPQILKSRFNTVFQALHLPNAISHHLPMPSSIFAVALPPAKVQLYSFLGHLPPHCCLWDTLSNGPILMVESLEHWVEYIHISDQHWVLEFLYLSSEGSPQSLPSKTNDNL